MPARFHQVSPGVWDRQLRTASRDAQVVAFYVWTCRLRVTEGLYELPLGHLHVDTGMDVDDILAALVELDAAGIVAYDPDAEVVLDRRALKDNPLRGNDKRIKAAVDRLVPLAGTPLLVELYRLACEHSPDLATAIGNALPAVTLAAEAADREATAKQPGATDPRADGASENRDGPSKGHRQDGASGVADGASRGEPLRGEGEDGSAEHTTMCGWCWDPARLEPTGQPLTYGGRPWCGACEPVDEPAVRP